MSGIKPITFYFKVKSKDELEVEELLHTQLSRHSNNKASSLESSRTISTVSAEIMSIITLVDLTTNNDDSYSAGGLTTLLPVYDSDVDDDDVVNVDLW